MRMYEKCKFLSMCYISALTQASVLIGSKNVRLLFSSVSDEFALPADICNMGSGFLATDYI